MNKANLLKMADHIGKIPQEKFDISVYRWGARNKPECDSVGCVIGHCTILDAENVVKNYLNSDGEIRFTRWSKDFTGLEYEYHEWMWCFDGEWENSDNTPTGAARRIRYLVEHGLPEDWSKQMRGKAPLCY